jgi:hypothetical protein
MVHMPEHHAANSKGYVPEHRLVMEQMLGRPLSSEEIVHHIDRNQGNNLPDNLQIMTQSEHAAMHHAEASAARWAHHYDACVKCGTTEREHKGHGMCARCLAYYRNHPDGPRWSRDHDACVMCGTTERAHKGWGRCENCYARWKRAC